MSLFVTLWTVAHQAPLSLDSPGKNTGEYPPPGDLSDPGTESEPVSLMSPALAGRFSTTSASWEAPYRYILFLFSISILRVMLYERQTADDRLLF